MKIITIHIPTARTMAIHTEGSSDEYLTRQLLRKWPFLPLGHVTIDGRSLETILREMGTPIQDDPPSPIPTKSAKKPASKRQTPAIARPTSSGGPPIVPVVMTPGQRKFKKDQQRRAIAERHRQYWIDKDNAKRAAEQLAKAIPKSAKP